MRRAFRDWPAAVLIIFTFVMSVLFTTIVGGLLTQLYRTQKHMANPNWYSYSKYITVSHFEGNNEDCIRALRTVLSQTACDEVTIGYSYCDGRMDFFSGGHLPESLYSGEVLTDKRLQNATDGFVYVDQKSLSECEKKDESLYYRTENGIIRVQGVLYNSYGIEKKVYRYIDLNDTRNVGYLHNIYFWMNAGSAITFFIGGDDGKKVETETEDILEKLKTEGFEASLSEKDSNMNSEDELMSSLRSGVLALIVILSFGTLMNAVQLWMAHRRRNIAIVLALGGSKKVIFRMLAEEFVPICFAAVILSVLIECIYGTYQTIQWKEILGMTVLSVLLCVVGIILYMIFLMNAMIKRGFLDVIAGE